MSVREVILIDGHSGSGKTDFAKSLAVECGYEMLSLDEVYPGWDGLDAGQALVAKRLLPAWLSTGAVTVPQWDWATMSYASSRLVPDAPGLVVEGCGAISQASMALAVRSIWLDAAESIRFERAIGRDGESYRVQWKRWALQEQRFLLLHRTRDLAGERIAT